MKKGSQSPNCWKKLGQLKKLNVSKDYTNSELSRQDKIVLLSRLLKNKNWLNLNYLLFK